MNARQIFVAIVAVSAWLISSSTAVADESLWALLKKGGQVVLIRHTVTTPGVGDPPGMRLEDCSTQRNLTEAGKQHARRIGDAFKARGIVVERVLSSPWCRCLDTARLAFGNAEVSKSLGNLFDRPDQEERQKQEMRAIVGAWNGKGNLVLVSHSSTIIALTGVNTGTGEMVVVTPRAPNELTVAGTLSVK